ncbi:FAD-dependent oxidoreductase, partial [Treponema sp. OttesenSCG-928-L16]|nr:FAD-dependent oxidoreductase [Treponema sp. OttesenSCG-928-L16]
AARLGSRETRHVTGLHTLTGEELLSGKQFEDTIACSAHPIDIHYPADTSQDLIYLECPGYIPYRSLVPRHHKNLIVAGRCISADEKAFASLRVQAPAMATGQAAGAASALSLSENVCFQDLNTQNLQDLLRKQNAEI